MHVTPVTNSRSEGLLSMGPTPSSFDITTLYMPWLNIISSDPGWTGLELELFLKKNGIM